MCALYTDPLLCKYKHISIEYFGNGLTIGLQVDRRWNEKKTKKKYQNGLRSLWIE